jgi:hypothetical protein
MFPVAFVLICLYAMGSLLLVRLCVCCRSFSPTDFEIERDQRAEDHMLSFVAIGCSSRNS